MNQKNKAYETKLTDLQSEKNSLEHRVILDETKNKETYQRILEIQNDSELNKNEKRELEVYVSKLESEIQVKKSSLIDCLMEIFYFLFLFF